MNSDATSNEGPIMTLQGVGNALASMRRSLRRVLRSRDSWSFRARSARRALECMDAHAGGVTSIFLRRRLGATHAEARLRVREAEAVLLQGGQMLMLMSAMVDRSVTREQLLDLLNVNLADRGKLQETDGFAEVVLCGFEDSASKRGDDFNSGPFFDALLPVVIDFLCCTREGRACGEKLFEPGAPLAKLPRYRRVPNGTLVRARPMLRVIH